MKTKEIDFKCPICSGDMTVVPGDVMHPGDPKFGITVFCPVLTCPAQEVSGHGDNAKEAYEVVVHKFQRRNL